MKYTGRTVLITGASRGIGKGIALHFMDNGAEVLSPTRLEMDLSSTTSIVSYFKILREKKTKVDILINNAAVLTSHYSTRIPLQDAVAMTNINFLAPFVITREFVKLPKDNDYGRVVNISSMAVCLEPMGDSVYAATKVGLTTITNIMAKEVAFMNITCNTLGVSAIETDMLKQLNKAKIDTVIAGLPIPRYATMDDILNVIDFFASEGSSYITAQTIYLGGVH